MDNMEALDCIIKEPVFRIREIPVYGDLIMAPMAGFTDMPYRGITRAFGSALSYTEIVSADGLLYESDRTYKLLKFAPAERPVVFQIFGNNVDQLEVAARRAEALGPDIIDLNLGCSISRIVGKGAGSALLSDPALVGRIVSRLVQVLQVPVTAKIRLGPERTLRNHREVARILEESGVSLIAVHGRTRGQVYSEPADWDAIAEVKQTVRVPVLGNGDIHHVADIDRMKRLTGCDGVMIGRGAVGNPWIFSRRDINTVSLSERLPLMLDHLSRMVDFYGEREGVVQFRKHLIKYLRGRTMEMPEKEHLLTYTRFEELKTALTGYLDI